MFGEECHNSELVSAACNFGSITNCKLTQTNPDCEVVTIGGVYYGSKVTLAAPNYKFLFSEPDLCTCINGDCTTCPETIVGIVVPIVAVLCVLFFGLFCCWRRKLLCFGGKKKEDAKSAEGEVVAEETVEKSGEGEENP
mmetsp:Transcript_30019/g.45524  ORF Transcript_30019/g.45524 Transcript_30019/m.45524 type:complete len:139 (+) Transcript_30019:27-443(+)